MKKINAYKCNKCFRIYKYKKEVETCEKKCEDNYKSHQIVKILQNWYKEIEHERYVVGWGFLRGQLKRAITKANEIIGEKGE